MIKRRRKFQQDVLQLIMIPINWCKEYIAWFERLEYISDTAGEMLFKGFFSMLMITAGILGCVCFLNLFTTFLNHKILYDFEIVLFRHL